MRAADVAGLLKDFAVDVREFIAKSVAKVDERFAALEQRLQDAPAPITAADVDHAVDEKIDRAFFNLIAPRLDPVFERLSIVEERAPVHGPKGDQGEPGPRGELGERGLAGDDGQPGVDGEPGERGEKGDRGEPGERGVDGQDGQDGKDVDEEALQARIDAAVELRLEAAVANAVAAAVAALPAPRDGIDGKDGQDGVDGTSVDEVEVQRLVEVSVGKSVAEAVASIPVPKDGIDGTKGEDGRDAYQIDVIDDLDVERSYPRGTHARWRGGVIRAFRATDPPVDGVPIEKLGWACLIDGIHELTPEATDNPREFTLRAATTSGKERTFKFAMPTPIYRGVWTEREFERGDLTTYDGSLWHCDRATKAKPGTQTSNPDWTLCTKRGRAGKDGEKGPKGDRGTDGRNGRDLTQLGFDGSKT